MESQENRGDSHEDGESSSSRRPITSQTQNQLLTERDPSNPQDNDPSLRGTQSAKIDIQPNLHIQHVINSPRICYPSKDDTVLSQLYNQPLVTTLSGFSHVANLVNPYELIHNVDEFVRQLRGNSESSAPQRRQSNSDEDFTDTYNQRSQSSAQDPPILQEMDTFVNYSGQSSFNIKNMHDRRDGTFPVPALPPIECSQKRGRLEPLDIEEYMDIFRRSRSDLELIERVFYGGFKSNQIRAALWPYLFGLVDHRGYFEKVDVESGSEVFLFVDHEMNSVRWEELGQLYNTYRKQWRSILPDQEKRFSTYRERKSLIERDVIRCDRLHPFYSDQPQNLSLLTEILMTYMMYDFDIGYVQGMSDLAGPILFLYNGDAVRTFWVFVEVMKLFRRNFEFTQKTIHFQLDSLSKLLVHTDPIFAQYLKEHDSSNCFFAFRAIVCQFKRELMKDDECDYSTVLYLWDTIWSVQIMSDLKKLESTESEVIEVDRVGSTSSTQVTETARGRPTGSNPIPIPKHSTKPPKDQFVAVYDPKQADSPRHDLTETEIFVLSLCLSMIRRERDLVFANQLDGTDITLHFIDPKLASDLNDFIEHAINIYSYLKNDFNLRKITGTKESMEDRGASPISPESTEGYDLLNDFLIINGASGS